MITIKEAITKRDLKKFVDFPVALYKDCPYFVPPLRMDELKLTNPKKNPSSPYCRTKYYLAYRDGKIVGRVSAIINGLDEEKTGLKRVRFCRIDFVEDREVARALMNAVEDFARAEGRAVVHGPIGYHDLDREGLLIEGFDRLSTFETQYSYPYYRTYLEELGYEKDADAEEATYAIPKKYDDRIDRIAGKIIRKYGLRILDMPKRRMIKQYGEKVFHLFDRCYSHLYGTVPLRDEVIRDVLASFGLVARLELISVVTDKDDNVIAAALVLPSIAEAVRKSRGRLTPLGIIRIMRAVRRPKVVDCALIGVAPEYQNRGVNAVVLDRVIKGAVKLKVETAESNLMLVTNQKIRGEFSFTNGTVTRRRRFYKKEVGSKN
ncbi:MAG: N-acetyltransferase [Clostridiales bacterium]|jgi:GNAT superfamily N-acetyltransferase|nr:N-acetyltransferase [Clostridiales bacterium]